MASGLFTVSPIFIDLGRYGRITRDSFIGVIYDGNKHDESAIAHFMIGGKSMREIEVAMTEEEWKVFLEKLNKTLDGPVSHFGSSLGSSTASTIYTFPKTDNAPFPPDANGAGTDKVMEDFKFFAKQSAPPPFGTTIHQ